MPRNTDRRITRRHVIVTLAALAGVFGELLALVSMTRVAGPFAVEVGQVAGKLGFPYDLRFTLFGVVSVVGWVGAILWTSPNPRDRVIGPWLNLPAALLAGVAVGLDHAVHADPAPVWQVLAFAFGPIITLSSSAMLHVVSGMLDRVSLPSPTSHRRAASGVRSGDSPDSPGGNGDSVTYEPVEDARTTADEPPALPPVVSDAHENSSEDVAPIAAGQAGVDAQVAWIVAETARNGGTPPTHEDVSRRYGVGRRTAFRRLGAARGDVSA